MRRISQVGVTIATICCFLGAIWSPEESVKWVLSALYVMVVSSWFGLSYRKESVKGTYLKREDDKLNYLNLRTVRRPSK